MPAGGHNKTFQLQFTWRLITWSRVWKGKNKRESRRQEEKEGGAKCDRVKEKGAPSKWFLKTSPSTSNRKLCPLQLSVGKGCAEGLSDCTGTEWLNDCQVASRNSSRNIFRNLMCILNGEEFWFDSWVIVTVSQKVPAPYPVLLDQELLGVNFDIPSINWKTDVLKMLLLVYSIYRDHKRAQTINIRQ